MASYTMLARLSWHVCVAWRNNTIFSTLDPEILAFLASIFASLVTLVSICVWPSTLLILALIFRKHILRALPYLTRLKAGDFEFEFGKRILELEQKAADADIPLIEEVAPEPIDPELLLSVCIPYIWGYRRAHTSHARVFASILSTIYMLSTLVTVRLLSKKDLLLSGFLY